MKLLITGEWHITKKQPRHRIDDYSTAVNYKVTHLCERAVEEKVDYIIQPGDMYDTHRAPFDLIAWLIYLLRDTNIKIITVYGQHDLRYHSSDKINTPVGIIESTGLLMVANDEPIDLTQDAGFPLLVYGSSWNEPIPKIADSDEFCTKIWVTHRMVIKKKLWEQQVDYELGNALLQRNDFDLIVTGDNHESFWYNTKDGKILINCGALLRDNIGQEHHHPHYWIYDAYDRTATQHHIPVQDFDRIMAIEEAKEEKARNEELGVFIEGLKNDVELRGMNFNRNLDEYLGSSEEDPGTIRIINEIMGVYDAKPTTRVRRTRPRD